MSLFLSRLGSAKPNRHC